MLLELVRALSMSSCQLEYTVVIAAFDLEEYGSQGSMVFVQDFIIPRILEPMGFPGFQGAIILDSVMNFNLSSHSQMFPHDYRMTCPDVVRDVERQGSKGDFLAMFARDYDRQLADRISHHWKQQDRSRVPRSHSVSAKVKLRQFHLSSLGTRLPKDEDDVVNSANFLRSDHARFWYANNEDFVASFKSILLTDTGKHTSFRGYLIS